MATLWLLFDRQEEHLEAAEFRELEGLVAGEVRAVFPDVAESALADDVWRRRHDDVALRLGSDVLVLRATLAALGDALADGAPFAAPRSLAEVAPGLAEPVYTLGAFERVERRVLAEGAGGDAADPAPVALWRVGALLDALAAPGPVIGRRVGLAHRFIDYYGEPRRDAIELVPAGVRDVLEVGCGAGVTGALLKQLRGCRVTGVELNPRAATRAAERLDRVMVGDVERLALAGRYDLVMALELFEHLLEPDRFLRRVRELLAAGGSVLLSVPNVGHWSVVEELLAGRWDYLPVGLQCYTHYRFYTRASLERRLRRIGFSRVELVPQATELPARFAGLAARCGLAVDEAGLAIKGFFVRLGD